MFNKTFVSTIAAVCCLFALNAEEQVNFEEERNVPVGTRSAIVSDSSIRETKNRHFEAEAQENELGEERVEAGVKLGAALKKNFVTQAFNGHYTSHPGAMKSIYDMSLYGIELIDRSVWTVNPYHTHILGHWYIDDMIVITPNRSWFSSYQFCLTNQQTGDSVEVNLTLGPIYNGYYTNWIVAIDDYYNKVYLNDGSVWSMSAFDSGLIRQWEVNDTVIIGVNNGWLSSTRPNILINVNMLNYATGICSY